MIYCIWCCQAADVTFKLWWMQWCNDSRDMFIVSGVFGTGGVGFVDGCRCLSCWLVGV